MKIKEIAEQHGFDLMWFEIFISRQEEALGIKRSGFFADNIADEDVPKLVEAYKAYEANDHKKEEEKQADEQLEKAREEILLTTCPTVEGYRVTKQFGLVFGECVYKTGFLKSLGASVDNFFDIMSFGDTELSGTSRILKTARDYSTSKMIEEALSRGANAVIGVDSESSLGGDIMHVTIYGTAVKIEPIEPQMDAALDT